ncbi:MAG: hypothetical protein IKL71_02575 [Bacteroidaceae bacterium]|nr:hypothetical protein [Bacteroidaceae bacterium]
MKSTETKSVVRLCCVAMFLLSAVTPALADEGVIVRLKNGQEYEFAFAVKPQIVFGKELSIIADATTKLCHDYADVRSIRFSSKEDTGIDEVRQDEDGEEATLSFRIAGNSLYVYGLPAGESVNIYNLAGQRVASQRQVYDGTALVIPLTTHGVLVVHTSTGVSYKIQHN